MKYTQNPSISTYLFILKTINPIFIILSRIKQKSKYKNQFKQKPSKSSPFSQKNNFLLMFSSFLLTVFSIFFIFVNGFYQKKGEFSLKFRIILNSKRTNKLPYFPT